MSAVVCPHCGGSGELSSFSTLDDSFETNPCLKCGGKGILTKSDMIRHKGNPEEAMKAALRAVEEKKGKNHGTTPQSATGRSKNV